MKRTLLAAAGFALIALTGLADAASWSVVVGPGVYGRVAVGGYVQAPQVYYSQPVIAVDDGDGAVVEEYVEPAYVSAQPPVYLWVPEYQRTHWTQYCRDYNTYGVPVYFVDDRWYQDNVMRRNWTNEQRSWNQVQWMEADRIARTRFEHERFEREHYERQRFEDARDDQQHWRDDDSRRDPRGDQHGRWEQARWHHDSGEHDGWSRGRWASASGWQTASQTRPGHASQNAGWAQSSQWN